MLNTNQADKIFIIGLPRTGTTSICASLLKLGYRVAHTAYTRRCMCDAQVIADTPIFCDYQTLAEQYPNAKFIYLIRDLTLWLPSIRQLLQRMHKNITRKDGGFNPILKRCYQSVFAPFTLDKFSQDEFLIKCYQQHYQIAVNFFVNRKTDLLIIDISEKDSFHQMLTYLNVHDLALVNKINNFERMNIRGKITAWNKIKDNNKIDSNLK